jgi:predicted DNA-binding transcriptional regulator YafY
MRSDSDYVFIAQSRMARVFRTIELLRQQRRTVEELTVFLDVDRRSVYRYLKLIDSIGLSIDKDFNQKYFIAECTCPFCGK